MKKRVFALFLIALFLIPLISSIVAAQDPTPVTPIAPTPTTGGTGDPDVDATEVRGEILKGTGCDWLISDDPEAEYGGWLYSRCLVWINGAKLSELTGTELGALGAFLKWFVLALIILLIYSVLAQVQFPESGAVRILIAVVVGFLATFFITSEEVITAMTGYSALGLTLVIFFPILILGFFTILIAKTTSPFGVYLQKILWVIFSVFLFIKSGMLFAIMRGWGAWGKIEAGKFVASAAGAINDATHYRIWGMVIKMTYKTIEGNYDSTVALTLLIAAIAIFIIMVIKNDTVVAWFAKEARESEAEAQKGKIERSNAYDELRAKQMQKG